MIDDAIFTKLSKQLLQRLEIIETRHCSLSFLIEKRYANEKLLQLETMNIISSMPEVIDYLPEMIYDTEGKKKCDFWFKTRNAEYWLEIKTCPTNYRKTGHAKAITNGVNGVIKDIDRLNNVPDPKAKKFVMFTFYPLYDESSRIFKIHLSRIAKAAGKEVNRPMISMRLGEAYFDIYIIEL